MHLWSAFVEYVFYSKEVMLCIQVRVCVCVETGFGPRNMFFLLWRKFLLYRMQLYFWRKPLTSGHTKIGKCKLAHLRVSSIPHDCHNNAPYNRDWACCLSGLFCVCGLFQEVLEEMKRFRDSLKRYYNSKDQSCISFERNFKSQHLQIQVCTCCCSTRSWLSCLSNSTRCM